MKSLSDRRQGSHVVSWTEPHLGIRRDGLRPSPAANSLYDLELGLSLPGTQDPCLKNQGTGPESVQSLLHLRRPGFLVTDLRTKILALFSKTLTKRKPPSPTGINQVLVISVCMSPQPSQALGTQWQMVWTVGSKMHKTDHPESHTSGIFGKPSDQPWFHSS